MATIGTAWIGRLLEDVAGQRSETAGVDRQRHVHRVLGAQERNRALWSDQTRVRLRGHQIVDLCLQNACAVQKLAVGRGTRERGGGAVLKQRHRVV